MHIGELLQLRNGAKDHCDHAVSLLTETLDPDIRRFVAGMTAAWARHGDLASVSHAEARQIAEHVRAPWTLGGPRMERVSERSIDGVRVRVYDPSAGDPKPALIYLHGGGWTLFSLDTHDRLMREYAARAGMIVIGVDYALSPEAKYPVALDQVVAVVKFVSARGGELDADAKRIAIGGDSAGANLAIASCLRLRDAHPVRAMLLNYGVFDRQSSREAVESFGGPGNMLTADEMEGFWRNYLDGDADPNDAFISPMRADLRGLPPAMLVVPECDLLTEQSLRLGQRLEEAGVPVRLELYRGAVHSFLEAVSIARIADRALDDSATWLRANV